MALQHGGKVLNETAAGTNSGASATAAADTVTDTGTKTAFSVDRTHIVESISGHGDADAVITIESPAATIIWESKLDVSAEGFSFNFPGIEVVGVPGQAILGKIASSSADCQVNITGRTV
jgi:hypothetical protein